jgi:WD40 repeat protein
MVVDWASECVLSGSVDSTLKLWDFGRAACIDTLRCHGCVGSLAVDWDSRQALGFSWKAENDNGYLELWNLDSATPIKTFSVGQGITPWPVAVDWASRRVLLCDGGTLKLWDLDQCVCTQTLRGHEGDVTGFAVDWTSRQAHSCSTDGTRKSWNLDRAICLSTCEVPERFVAGVIRNDFETRLVLEPAC